MPELPEVETIRRGLARLEGATIADLEVRERRFRRRVDEAALRALVGRRIERLGRRAKYLLFRTGNGGGMIVHLGMSGRLFLVPPGTPLAPHDHVSWWLDCDLESVELRLRDPRRFGVILSRGRGDLEAHPALAGLGPEPLAEDFDADYAVARTRRSRRPVKNTLMDAHFVAGVGNIYASEALWRAAVNPKTRSGRIAHRRWDRICGATKEVLARAVEVGGTTLNDFRDTRGDPGYFQIELTVYGREGAACPRCGATVRRIVQAGRATFYCPGCQR